MAQQLFFDKNGDNLNFQINPDLNIIEGTIYFEGISTYLFDNENIFVVEEDLGEYRHPTMSPGESIIFEWESIENEDIFFLYEVTRDIELNEQFINRLDSYTLKYEDINPTGTGQLDISAALQINIGFSPQEEIKYTRVLNVYLKDGTNPRVLAAKISFYGEGIEEDERFKIWSDNFGIKFLRTDANILKEYNIKEAIPNFKELNQARKELLVSKEHIYPYVGTYKGLQNIINLFGYKDTLRVKEYWKNVNPRSSYFDKMTLVDISDYLDDGVIDTLDLTDKNRGLKEGRQFKKTEFLALAYQFTRESGDYDDDGIPIVEETTEFTVDEIFYKMNMLDKKLKQEFLPINVKIKDLIGEFIYFQKYTISAWQDNVTVTEYNINERASVGVYPDQNVDLTLRNLYPFYRRVDTTGQDFGVARVNNNDAMNPFEGGQKYTKSENAKIKENIQEYYKQIRDQRIPNLNARLSWEFGDDPERIIGAPILLTFDLNQLNIFDFRGVQLQDLDEIAPGLDPYWTLENIQYRNNYEITWRITKDSPKPYNFEYRGKVVDLFQLAHFLPYAGTYRVTMEITDFGGHKSIWSRFITVQNDQRPQIIAYSRLEDKFDYTVGNLSNVQLQDFGASYLYYPKVNVLDAEEAAFKMDVYKNLMEWISMYKTRYGMGQHINDVELYDTELNEYVAFNDPIQDHPKKRYWGLGENDLPVTLADLRDVQIGELYWMRIANLVHLDDFNAGFYLQNPTPGKAIKISLFSDYVIPEYGTLEELVEILNDSNHPGIRLFNYEIINGRVDQEQYIIHAQAEYFSKEMYHILDKYGGLSPDISSPGNGNLQGDKYTFFLPKKVHSPELIDWMKSISPVFDDETMFLLAKTSDVLSGAVQDPMFWQENKYWKFENDEQTGHLPTVIDMNAFNLTDTKIFESTFAVPENAIVHFVINNLDGKNEFIWTLTVTETGEEIVRAKGVPFFVWKFKDLGNFTLKVDTFDNRGTQYTSEIPNFVRVLDKRTYISETEARLNNRKRRLLKERGQ